MAKPRGKRHVDATGAVRVAGKRANGEGTAYYDASKNRWRASYTDPAGKRRTVLGATRAEAEARRDARVADLATEARGVRLAGDATVAEVARWWLTNTAALTVRPSTLHSYRKDVERIVSHVGHLPMRDLDTEAVRALVADLHHEGRSPGTITNTRTRLRQVCAAAVELGHLSANPVTGVRVPKQPAAQRKTKRVLAPAEVRALLGSLDGAHPLDAVAALLFTNGLRVSECLGLAWHDVDLDAGTATIRRACTYVGGGIGATLDAPKTLRTVGTIVLSPTTVELLRHRADRQQRERAAAGAAWQRTDYEGTSIELVFTTALGGLVVRQDVTNHLRRRLVAAGIDPVNVATHTGRRSVVTGAFASGLPIDDVARLVGHADPSTTAGYVQHLGNRPEATARAAHALFDPAAAGDA